MCSLIDCTFLEGFSMNNIYKIIKSDNYILALSKIRIPFDLYLLKGERKENILSFRNELISAIKELSPNENQILIGKYGSTDKINIFFDVENILFYNIGTGNFKHTVFNGISFSSFNEQEIEQILGEYGNEYSCIYEYSVIDKNENIFSKDDLIASWNQINMCKFLGSKPTDYWCAIKSNQDKIQVFDSIDTNNNDLFGLDLIIYVPNGKSVNIATAMKPFLDGLICAFHGEANMETDFDYLQEKVGCTENWLHNHTLSVLGTRQYLYKYRDNIKWNPADDLCKTVRITIESSNDENWKLSGRIIKL